MAVNLNQHDLQFILDQIKIAEAHSAGTPLADLVDSPLLPNGLRTVDGSYNNFGIGREQWGSSGEPFGPITEGSFPEGSGALPEGYGYPTNNDYGEDGHVVDAEPRLISNLIVDQTLDNPAAIAAALQHAGLNGHVMLDAVAEIRTQHDLVRTLEDAGLEETSAYATAKGDLDDLLDQHGVEMDGSTVMLPNVAPDEGISASYNSVFTLFGQFFDHGLDLVSKGGNGTVFMPLSPDDPLYNPDSPHTNFMVMTRATTDENAGNVTTPWVDQNQTYTSHPSHHVFLREYEMVDGKPVATGRLLDGDRGLPTWGDIKEQARTLLGIELTDKDVGSVPLVAVDPYGEFLRGDNGLPQLVTGFDEEGNPILTEGNLANPIDPSEVGAGRAGVAFLDDIAHAAVPVLAGGELQPDDDDAPGYSGGFGARGTQTAYDDELLDAHYINGDGRGNENVGLTAIHHIFHSEHNRIAEQVKNVALESGDLNFLNQWLLGPDLASWPAESELDSLAWDGERIFQAARFTTEMEYQHLVFEEFARKIQPDVDVFIVQPDAELNPVIFSEFAHVVYRFGHSMLNETVDRINADGTRADMDLFDAFLNPLAFGSDSLSHDEAAGAILRGMTAQTGNEIDEFVTNTLRNQLLGIPLDLPAINIARGRDTGMPTLNEARAQFMEMADGDSQLRPYTSWADFAENMKNPASVINFIAAYGTHESVTSEDTIAGRREAATDLVLGAPDESAAARAARLDWLNAPAEETGVNDIDLWMGGLAEKKMPFGGMLGSTFAFVFEMQLENLQDADRFYYLSRTQGLNLLTELENNSLAKMALANTDLGETGFALPADIFSAPDHILYLDHAKQLQMTGEDDPQHEDPFLESASQLVERRAPDDEGDGAYLRYNGDAHVVVQGTDGADHVVAGGGDDTVWGGAGNDRIEAGYGVDLINGGEGDDIITNSGTDIGETDMLKGDDGNDVIHGGSGLALIFGGRGKDFLITGPDGSEIRAGMGDDFLLGGDGPDMLFGNEGHDWVEGKGRFEYIAGDNGELFFNSTVIGHDVINGGRGDTDYDADSGDDIMVAGEGIQKNIGMWGHDWVIHKGQNVAADADMNVEVFTTLPLEVLRDRFSQVEAMSGWVHDDILRGDDRSDEEEEVTPEIADPTPEGNFVYNELDQAGIDRIDGLDRLITPEMMRDAEYWADGSGAVKSVFTGGNILLGGGGNDLIEGRGGDDVIDGDAWLNVRIAIMSNRDGTGDEIATVDSMDGPVTLTVDGTDVTRPLSSWMVEGRINPGQLQIVREILDGGEAGDSDIAVYTDVMENYTITVNADESITVSHTGFSDDDDTVDDDDDETTGEAEGGRNAVSDGTDTLHNIEVLRFSDGDGGYVDVPVDQLVNSPATGAPTISDTTPTEGDSLSVDLSGIVDANGMPEEGYSFQWQYLNGATWSDIPGAESASFTPNDPGFLQQLLGDMSEIGRQLRVEVSFVDNAGNVETVYSEPTAAVEERSGQTWNRSLFTGATFNGSDGDDHATGSNGSSGIFGIGAYSANETLNGNGGNDTLIGRGGADTLNGGSGSDRLDGGTGDDVLDGGADSDVISGGAGNDTIIQNSTEGRDFVDGGAGTDTFQLNGNAGSETFAIYSRTAAETAITGLVLAAATEIVITRNGEVIAELDNIEEIRINSLQVTSPGGADGGANEGDRIEVVGDFNETSLNFNTITIDGDESADTIDISALASAHRIVFRSNGGQDTILGTLRPQDVIELPVGSEPEEYELVENENGTTTLASATHSVTFTSDGLPEVRSADPAAQDDDTHHDEDDLEEEDVSNDDDDHDDDHQDDSGGAECDDDDDVTAPPAAPAGHGIGTAEADVLIGTAGDDTLLGLGGDDSVLAGAGDDVITGGDGSDFLSGEGGRDVIFAGKGNDDVLGGAGADMLYGDAGNDRMLAGSGSDLVNGGRGSDVIFGGEGDDTIVAEAGDGNDTYYGDDMDGGTGTDTLDMSAILANIDVNLGSGGSDRGTAMSSETGRDTLYGVENIVTGAGDDEITASRAVNVIDGGDGNDTFRFLSARDADGDTLASFQPGDRIDLGGIDADANACGDQSFTLVSDGFTGAGQLMVSEEVREDGTYTVVSGTTDDDDEADFSVGIRGSHQLTEEQFGL